MNTRQVGDKYEALAIKYLVDNGAKIIETNYHFHKIGEIDIIYYDIVNEYGENTKYLCFAEVKYRKSNKGGGAISAVDYGKQKKICEVAMGYIKSYAINPNHPMRFDIIAIDGNELSWVKNAFEYVYR